MKYIVNLNQNFVIPNIFIQLGLTKTNDVNIIDMYYVLSIMYYYVLCIDMYYVLSTRAFTLTAITLC